MNNRVYDTKSLRSSKGLDLSILNGYDRTIVRIIIERGNNGEDIDL